LRGPLTRPQVKQLMGTRKEVRPAPKPTAPRPAAVPAPAAEKPAPPPSPGSPEGYSSTPPALAPEVPQVFLPVEVSQQAAARQVSQADVQSIQLVYEPGIVGSAEVRYLDRKRGIDHKVDRLLLATVPEGVGGVAWDDAETPPLRLRDLASGPERVGVEQGPFFAPLPEEVNTARELKSIGQDLSDWLYYNSKLSLTAHAELDLVQHPGETERAFKIRLQQAARERRDAEVDALEQKYASRIDKLQDSLRRKERELAADEAEHAARSREELLNVGETVLGLFMGRRSTSAIGRAATKRRITSKAKIEIEDTRDEIADLQEEVAKLEAELKQASDEITQRWDSVLDDLITQELAPRRSDVDVNLVAVAWMPSWLISYQQGDFTRTARVHAYPQAEGG
jgi:phage host-nuclease inhibitor protein Gam